MRRLSATPRDPPGSVPRTADWKDPGLSGSPPRLYPFLYLDHGAKSLVRSEHDNTAVVRWSLRERGIVLAGPHPRDLVDPVASAELRADARRVMALGVAVGLQPIDLVVWQSFWVQLYCRALHTLATGGIASKKAGCAWAAAVLDSKWKGLVERAQAVREGDRILAMAPAAAADIEATFEFVRYAMDLSNRHESLRSKPQI